jgi:hypothetical protein
MHTMELTTPQDTTLDLLDADLGIEELDEMIDPDFWDGFKVGATIGIATAAGAIAIAT